LLVRCGDLHRNTNMLVFSEQKREILVDFVDLLLDSLLALWDTSQPSCAGHLLNCGLKKPVCLALLGVHGELRPCLLQG